MPKKKKNRKPWDSAPMAGEREIGKSRIDRITSRRTFETDSKPSVGNRFYIFKKIGDQVIGRVVGEAIANLRRSSSWPIELEDGEIVEIFGNKILHANLKPCLGRQVRIVFIGRESTSYGHSKKIHRVYVIDAQGNEERVMHGVHGPTKKARSPINE